jgi:hypothetical protein
MTSIRYLVRALNLDHSLSLELATRTLLVLLSRRGPFLFFSSRPAEFSAAVVRVLTRSRFLLLVVFFSSRYFFR